jgi:type IV pilus assembly protein PilF
VSLALRSTVLGGIALALAGCADQPVRTPLAPEVPMSRQKADARTRAELHTQLGAGYYELRNFKVALEELQEALQTDPNYGPAHNMLALVYMELREDALAEQSFERALRINSADSEANNNYGWFLCQRKRFDEAMKYFEAALRNPLYQTPDMAHVNAGICLRERGSDAEAMRHFERARELQPGNPTALYHLADLAFRRGLVTQARGLLQDMGRTGAPFGAEALWLALRVERALGNREAEASYGLQLRKNFPNSRETQALLSRQFE